MIIKKIYYIIGCHDNYIKSYDYSNNQLYHKYYEEYYYDKHFNAIIDNINGIITLFDCDSRGLLRIWNFHTAILIKKIDVGITMGIRLLNSNFVLMGCANKSIKLINISNGEFAQKKTGHNNWICTIKIINHPKYGKCLISQGLWDDFIKIWTLND